MKKSKLLVMGLALIMGTSVFALAGCGGGCEGGSSGGGSETPPTPPTPPTPVEQPKKEAMSKFFSGVKATYTKENIVDSNGTTKEFKKFVDRQIDVLAQDLLKRLDYVYGEYRLNPLNLNHWGESYDLSDPYSTRGYVYRDMKNPADYYARTDSTNILAQLSNAEINKIFFDTDDPVTLTEVNIDDLSDYQRSLLIIETPNNYLAYNGALNLIGASLGKNMQLTELSLLDDTTNNDKVWKVSQLTTEETKNNLKLIIAQILSNDAGSDYDALISKIDKLGFDSTFKDKLIDVINENIIGSDRIAEDDKYYKELVDNYSGIINSEAILAMMDNEKYTTTYSPRLYKGYKKLVPVIVNSALDNKFYGTNISLYPTFSNIAHDYSTDATGFKDAHDYNDVTLLAKANTLYTKLVVKIKGSDLSSSEASLEYQLEINGKPVGTKKEIKLSETEKEFTLDISGYGTSFGEYKGNTEKDVNTKIFEKTTISDSNTETNYIKFNFTNSNGAKFTITFDGYYDKNAQ